MTFFAYRITNAASEGLNSKIQTIKKMAYGFRNQEHFKLPAQKPDEPHSEPVAERPPHFTMSCPFMPRLKWPRNVQTKSYSPGREGAWNVVSVVSPDPTSGVATII